MGEFSGQRYLSDMRCACSYIFRSRGRLKVDRYNILALENGNSVQYHNIDSTLSLVTNHET
jgi:hypothetical protein